MCSTDVLEAGRQSKQPLAAGTKIPSLYLIACFALLYGNPRVIWIKGNISGFEGLFTH